MAGLATVTTAGGVAAILNPLGKELLITRTIMDVTTAATGAATVDVGVAANATTSDDALLDGQDVNSATGMFASTTLVKWPATGYVTASQATGAVAGLVGTLHVEYIRA